MNPLIEQKLQGHVERAVRPVEATDARKLAFRTELLAHLLSTFEEELTKDGDESAALKRAKERFGSPENLTDDLQDSVSAVNRWQARTFGYHWNRRESWLHFAFRRAGFDFLLITLYFVWLLLVAQPNVRSRPGVWREFATAFVFFSLVVPAVHVCFVGTLASLHGVFSSRRSLWRALAFGAGAGFLSFVFGPAFGISMSSGGLNLDSIRAIRAVDWALLLSVTFLLFPGSVLLGASILGRRIQKTHEWEQLELDPSV